MVGPGDTAAAVAVSTERLRQRLQQEGLSEAAIADSERIVREEFEALQKQELLETPPDLVNLGVTEVMEASFTFKTSLNEWHNHLCDINFWLDGYLHTPAYGDLELNIYEPSNVGVGAPACFARAISSIARDFIIRMRLQELPLLKHLHVDNTILTAPAWEELHVRGCWSLRRLPRLSGQPDKKQAAVKVSGERAWWDKLRWDGTRSHRGSYEPMLPPAFASRGERVVIESYLR